MPVVTCLKSPGQHDWLKFPSRSDPTRRGVCAFSTLCVPSGRPHTKFGRYHSVHGCSPYLDTVEEVVQAVVQRLGVVLLDSLDRLCPHPRLSLTTACDGQKHVRPDGMSLRATGWMHAPNVHETRKPVRKSWTRRQNQETSANTKRNTVSRANDCGGNGEAFPERPHSSLDELSKKHLKHHGRSNQCFPHPLSFSSR